MRVAGYWCDVVTANYYGAWNADFELLANQANWAGKPVVITEWYAKGMDVWEKDNRMTNKSGAGFTVRTQTDRGLFYQNYALMLMECKGCVGFDWFQYIDNDPSPEVIYTVKNGEKVWKDESSVDANKGIVDNSHRPYDELVEAMTEINKNVYRLIEHFDSKYAK
jgi:hypothetical protein